jgi:hypothetical protein
MYRCSDQRHLTDTVVSNRYNQHALVFSRGGVKELSHGRQGVLLK